MARHTIAPIPEGYTIIHDRGRFYPMFLTLAWPGIPGAKAFVKRNSGIPVAYSKRALAVEFLNKYTQGNAPWAAIHGEEIAQGRKYHDCPGCPDGWCNENGVQCVPDTNLMFEQGEQSAQESK